MDDADRDDRGERRDGQPVHPGMAGDDRADSSEDLHVTSRTSHDDVGEAVGDCIGDRADRDGRSQSEEPVALELDEEAVVDELAAESDFVLDESDDVDVDSDVDDEADFDLPPPRLSVL